MMVSVVVVRLLQLPGDARVLADEQTAELMERMLIGKVLDRPAGPPPQPMRVADRSPRRVG